MKNIIDSEYYFMKYSVLIKCRVRLLKNLSTVLLLLYMACSNAVYANSGEIPYASSVKTGYDPNKSHYKHFVKLSYDHIHGIGDLDVPIDSKGYLLISACGSFAHAYGSKCMAAGNGIKVEPNTTWREAIDKWTKKHGSSGNAILYGEATFSSSDLCMGIGVATTNLYIHSKPIWIPGTECLTAPPESLTCSVTSTSLDFNFGTLSLDSIDGATQNQSLNLTCNAIATAKVSIHPPSGYGGGIPLYDMSAKKASVVADLTFDDKPLTAEKNVSFETLDGTQLHTLKAKLRRNPPYVNAGVLSASLILYLDIQ